MDPIFSGKSKIKKEFIYANTSLAVSVSSNGIQKIYQDSPAGLKVNISNILKPFWCFIKQEDSFFDAFESSAYQFYPHKAILTQKRDDLLITTEIAVSQNTNKIIQKVNIENISDKNIRLNIIPVFSPEITSLLLKQWDSIDIYSLSTYFNVKKDEEFPCFLTEIRNSQGNINERKQMLFYCSLNDVEKYTLDSENLFENISEKKWNSDKPKYGSWNKNVVYGKNFVNAITKKISIPKKDSFSFEMNLVFLDVNLTKNSKKPFDFINSFPNKKDLLKNLDFEKENDILEKISSNLFQNIDVEHTSLNALFNKIIPLQLHWNMILCRSWTGWKGVRDVAQDSMGYLYINQSIVREKILELFKQQRNDGSFFRQYTGIPHLIDDRKYVDSGLWVIQLIITYIKHTGDIDMLKEKVNDKNVKNLLTKSIDFFLDEKNIGVHGISKVWGGDWQDAVEGIGIQGKGESIMVTAHLIICLKEIISLFSYYSIDAKTVKIYQEKIKFFSKNLKNTINSEGYFDGFFTDGGNWIISAKDIDGKKRIYTPANSYALMSKLLSKKEEKRIVKSLLKSNKTKKGYRLFTPPYVGNTGVSARLLSADLMPGIAENGTCYNHGGNGFFAEALSFLGYTNEFVKTFEYMLPSYSQDKSYEITNHFPEVVNDPERKGGSFLTASVSLTLRLLYREFFGIRNEFEGIVIDPKLSNTIKKCSLKYVFKGNIINFRFIKSKKKKIIFNNEILDSNFFDSVRNRNFSLIPNNKIKKVNSCEILFI